MHGGNFDSTDRPPRRPLAGPIACPGLPKDRTPTAATVSRALNEFESRGWIERHDDGYEATTLGQLIVREFDPLLETMECVAIPEEVTNWLPTEQMSLNLYELGDGELISPSQKNLSSHIEAGLDAVRNADHLRVLGNAVIPIYVKVFRDCIVEGELTSEQVYGRKAREMMADHEHVSGQVEGIIDSGSSVYRFDGVIPYNLFVLDESVIFFLCDETSLPESLLVTENDAVLSWAESTFESFRTKADSLDRETTVLT